MNFNPNKTPVEIIKEGVFGSTYFRDIYSRKWKVVQKMKESI